MSRSRPRSHVPHMPQCVAALVGAPLIPCKWEGRGGAVEEEVVVKKPASKKQARKTRIADPDSFCH